MSWKDRANELVAGTLDAINVLGSVGTIVSLGLAVYSVLASYLLWRASWRRHKFSKVYFPRSREDFYDYYTRCIAQARKNVYLTSDGFNMRNSLSRAAALRMNEAQEDAINRGAYVVRYQMVRTMHLNWLNEVCKLRERHGRKYRTYINPKFENIGNFAVIDYGTRRVVTEFMLPDLGGIGQATTARDYGFVHGHQAKADVAKALFDRIVEHPESIEVTMENVKEIMQQLLNERIEQHLNDPRYHIFDDEVLYALKASGSNSIRVEDLQFDTEPS